MENQPDSQQIENTQEQDSQPINVDESSSEGECNVSDDDGPTKFNEVEEFEELEQKLKQGDHSFCFGSVLAILTIWEDEDIEIDKLIQVIEALQRKKLTTKPTTKMTLRLNKMNLSHVKAFIYRVKKHEIKE
jgi:hypothetical protein